MKQSWDYEESTPEQTQVYEIFPCVQIEILDYIFCVEVSPWIQDTHWNNPP